MPFVEVNGVEYVDSSLIIKDLTKVFHKDQMESFLSDEQRAAARAFEHLAEYSLIWSNMKFKVPNFDKIAQLFPPNMFPPFMKLLFPIFANSMKDVVSVGKHATVPLC